MLRYLFIALILLIFIPQLFSQVIGGRVVDADGVSIPYATVFVEELLQGTTTNIDGVFELPVERGTYHVKFRCMGYIAEDQIFELVEDSLRKTIVLAKQNYQLPEVKVYATGEDPAYPIMRRAVSMAPYYLNQVSTYVADVYQKATGKIEKMPKILQSNLEFEEQGQTFKIEVGQLYVGENMSRIEFVAPDQYSQVVISSNLSLPVSESISFDFPIQTQSIYQPDVEGILTPFSPSAFSHYDFKYLGNFMDGNYLINKIEVTPKRKNQQLLEGTLYIVEGLWCVHSSSLVNEQNFVEITTDVQYAEVEPSLWMPISNAAHVSFKMIGVKGFGKYLNSIKYRKVELNTSLEKPKALLSYDESLAYEEELKTKELSKRQEKINALLEQEKLSNREAIKLAGLMEKELDASKTKEDGKRDLEIKENFEKKSVENSMIIDSTYWAELRPYALDTEELQSYESRDSIIEIVGPITDDNMSEVGNNNGPLSIVGKQRKRTDRYTITYDGLVAARNLSFNPVEGWAYRQKISLSHSPNKKTNISLQPDITYAFNAKKVSYNVGANLNYAPMKRARLSINFGSDYKDFIGENGASSELNTLASLFFKENYARLYRSQYFHIYHRFDVSNGLVLNTGFEYSKRDTPENSTNFSFFYRDDDYQANIPINPLYQTSIHDAKTSMVQLRLNYTPRLYYKIKNGRKISKGSSLPTFEIGVKHAFEDLLGSNTNWTFADVKIHQRRNISSFSSYRWLVGAGGFANSKSVHFADMKSFKSFYSPVEFDDEVLTFRLLPYYQTVNNDWYAEAHFQYSAHFLLLKLLPGLSNGFWKEGIGFDYLYTDASSHYTEFGYRALYIFGFLDLNLAVGFNDFDYQSIGLKMVIDIEKLGF